MMYISLKNRGLEMEASTISQHLSLFVVGAFHRRRVLFQSVRVTNTQTLNTMHRKKSSE